MSDYQEIRLKRSNVQDSEPSNADLVTGEVAINTYDGRLFTKTLQGAQEKVVELSTPAIDNVLYVSKSGSDDNDGTTLARSFLTIKAALAEATSGTAVFVKAGDYTETNPVTIPAGVSVIGDGLRVTTVRPSTTNQDLFYVNNASYITGFTFRDHVSPAAAIAYDPTKSGDDRPIITTSPYIQNCSSITTTGTGMKIDGSKVRGDIRSMVCDSYTQFNQGGIGVHLLNRGYAQLVSVFTICCEDGFLCESGGFCSITNSNSSFGTRALKATGNSQVLYSGFTNGVDQTGRTFVLDGLGEVPNIGDSVKFAGVNTHFTVESVESTSNSESNITLVETVAAVISDDTAVNFHQRSLITASGHTFEYVGSGTNIANCLPALGGVPVPENEAVQDENFEGRVFYTGTNERGDFSVSGDFVVNQNTGTVTGRTFDKSLFAVMTPYILALEG